MMGFDAGYATPIDAIEDLGTHIFMGKVYVQWGPAPGLARSSVHAVQGNPHMYHEISAFYPTENPAQATIWVEPEAEKTMISCLWVNRGVETIGDIARALESDPHMDFMVPLKYPSSFMITDHEREKDFLKVDINATRPVLLLPNGVDIAGFPDMYMTEKWRIVSATGAARFAGGKFQIEPTKGYVGINTAPFTGIAMLIRAAVEGDRGLAIVRPSSTAVNRLLEFQDETYNIQGMAIDSNGRPVAVGTPARVTPGDQVSYANPRIQVRDIAGNVTAAVRPSPTAPGTVAIITFSRPYAQVPLFISVEDHSAIPSDLYVSARSATSFTVSTRVALKGGSILSFDYAVIA